MKRLKNWQELNKKEKAIRVLTIWMIVIVPLYAIMQRLPQCDSLLYSIFNIIVRFFYAPWIFFPFIIFYFHYITLPVYLQAFTQNCLFSFENNETTTPQLRRRQSL